MTFQEAQTQFSSIVSSLSPTMSSSELVQKQRDLQNLLTRLPNTREFDPLVEVIVEFSPRLVGQVTQAVIEALRSHDATFKAVSGLLTHVSRQAAVDARTLTFEQPQLVAAALTESLNTLQELRTAAQFGNFAAATAKVDALVALVEHVRASIKAT